MNLTPLDIEKAVFRRALFGYNRQEVDLLLGDVAHSLEEYLTQVAQLQARVGQLEAEVARQHENEVLQANNAALAQRTADELVAAARERATGIKREAELEAELLRKSLAELRAERDQFEARFQSLLTTHLAQLQATQVPPAASGNSGAYAGALDSAATPSASPVGALRSATALVPPAPPAAAAPALVQLPAVVEAPRISLQPVPGSRAPLAEEPSRAELIDMLSGGGVRYSTGPDGDAAELERILAAAQPSLPQGGYPEPAPPAS